MFKSGAEHYDKNLTQSGTCVARPATMTKPTGEQVPAVVLFNMRQVRAVLPITEALRLANELADAIATHNQTKAN